MVKERRYKIMLGYDKDSFIPISEEELPKAIYAHMSGSKAVFANGSISGTQITGVVPDYHEALGYSHSYRFGAEEWNEVHYLRPKYEKQFAAVSAMVQRLAAEGRKDLLSLPLSKLVEHMPQLDAPHNAATAALAEGMKA